MQDALPAQGSRMCQNGPAAGWQPELVPQDVQGSIPGKDATLLLLDEFIVLLALFDLSESQIDYQQKRQLQRKNNGYARLWPYVVMDQSGCSASDI